MPKAEVLCLIVVSHLCISGILFVRYLVIANEFSDGKGIVRFAILRGVFTPKFSVVCTADVSDLRTVFSVDNLCV